MAEFLTVIPIRSEYLKPNTPSVPKSGTPGDSARTEVCLDKADPLPPDCPFKIFMKPESWAGPLDPRLVSTDPRLVSRGVHWKRDQERRHPGTDTRVKRLWTEERVSVSLQHQRFHQPRLEAQLAQETAGWRMIKCPIQAPFRGGFKTHRDRARGKQIQNGVKDRKRFRSLNH